MTDKDQVIKTKYVIKKTIIEKYMNDLPDEENSCDHCFQRSQQKHEQRRRKEAKRRKPTEANKEETRPFTGSICDFKNDCGKCDMSFVENSHPDLAESEDKLLEARRTSSSSTKDQNSEIGVDQEVSENPSPEHQNSAQCTVGKGVHNEEQTSVTEPDVTPNKVKSNKDEIVDASTADLKNDNEEVTSDTECDCEKGDLSFVENSHPDLAESEDKLLEARRTSSSSTKDQNSEIEMDQEVPENSITEHQNSSYCSFEEDGGNVGQVEVETLHVVPITEEDNKGDSLSRTHFDSTKLQENSNGCSIPVREPEMVPIMVVPEVNIEDVSSDQLDFDLFDILVSQTLMYSNWMWKFLKFAFKCIYAKAKENCSTYRKNKSSVTSSESCVPATVDNKETTEKYKTFQQLTDNPEPVALKVSTSCAVQPESVPHLKSDTEACQSEDVGKQQSYKLCDPPFVEKWILLKIQRNGNLEIIDVDRNEKALTPSQQINTLMSSNSGGKGESEFIIAKEIDADTTKETVSNTPLSDEAEIQKQPEPPVQETDEKIESDKSKSYHVASVANCFKFLMEKFYAEPVTGLEEGMLRHGKKVKEDSDQGDNEISPAVHEASLVNCYTFLVEEYRPDLAAVLKEYCDGQELVIGE
nr:hypothetical protein HmN_000892500 [Hymenolepis microstoma]